jgi:hypothetical protein
MYKTMCTDCMCCMVVKTMKPYEEMTEKQKLEFTQPLICTNSPAWTIVKKDHYCYHGVTNEGV